MTANRRVLHVVRRFHPMIGGTESLALELARAQARIGHTVTVLTADRDVTGVFRERLSRSDRLHEIRVVRVPVIGNRRATVTLRPDTLLREMRRAHTIHLHDLRFHTGLVALACRLLRRPLMVHTHGLFFHTQFATHIKHGLIRAFYGPLLAATGAWVIASSEHDRAELLARAPWLAARTRVLENAVDLTRFPPRPAARSGSLIVAVGRVTESKGLDDLLRAFAGMTVPEAQLVIAGPAEAPHLMQLRELADRLGVSDRVQFVGPIGESELPELLGHARLAAFPSRAEGFGMGLLEAMASGTPVVARDIPAHRTLLGEQLTGALVDFADPRAAAEALTNSFGFGEREQLLLAERERQRASLFDIARYAAEIDELYDASGA